MEALDLEHPSSSSSSSSRNNKELLFNIGECWTTPGAPNNSAVQFCEFKGRRGIEQRNVTLNTEREKRATYKRGVHSGYNRGAVTSAKMEDAVKKARMKTWHVCAIPFHLKTMVKMMGWPHFFLWSMVVLLSLCPESASSQVRDAHCGPPNACRVYIVFNLFVCMLNKQTCCSRLCQMCT